MGQLNILHENTFGHPMDVVEDVMISRDWPFSRSQDDELAGEFRGKWCDLQIHFAWSEEIAAIHTACSFDFRIPNDKRAKVHDLLALINDKLWVGHFCVWQDDGLPMFRHTQLMRGSDGATPQQIEDLLDVAIVECERFYPSFQFVVWGGKEPQEALDAAIIEPVGKA